MSAATQALSLFEIVAAMFAHLAEPDSWTASTVSLTWWNAAQHVAFLTRDRVCSDPDGHGVHLLEALLAGPRSAGGAVRHVHLAPGVSADPYREAYSQPLSKFTGHVVKRMLSFCPNIVSLTVYGLDHGEAPEELIDLFKETCGTDKLETLQLVGISADLSTFSWTLPFPNLRHLSLTGLPSPVNLFPSYDQIPLGLGFDSSKMDFDPPELNLTSLTLTNIGSRVVHGRASLDSLSGTVMTWLLRAASRQPAATQDSNSNRNDGSSGTDGSSPPTGLRTFRYLLDGAERGTALSADALAALATHAPSLERAELQLTPDNVGSDLEAVAALTASDKLARLELGLFVPANPFASVPGARGHGRNELARLRAKLGKRVAELDEGRRAKVTLLD